MADISITQGQIHPVHNSQNLTSINNRPNIKAVNAPEVQKDDGKADAVRQEELREEILENVVSVSEDGDTVQVSDDGAAKLNAETDETKAGTIQENNTVINDEERVAGYPYASKPEVNIEISIKDTKPETDQIEISPVLSDEDSESYSADTSNISSYVGYTDTQLEQMYLKGDISKFDYDQEMEAREEEREAIQNNDQDTSKQIMATVSGMERVTQDADQLQKAFSEDSVQTPDAAQRVEIMTTLQDFTKLQ